ncbi:class II aldolase/adducin family protein [Parvibaculum lavamentivorans DS-1]|uniref:Class II aldolase/adducin family protein n=1 Tax=Parvibaculum lavamentivorans (strain DS-1 / DSM 13023 / NCIMB 13966) TaxID=402881 RepID=A7HVC9_PARL1|nr:class II aldolase/adducin family protein [Parvibaculum lavamentivorans]ABS63862.1 class II aldolase/adducin family protein [Parvibaculum lavamentivorans DS-1]
MTATDEAWLRQRVVDAALDLAATGLSPQMSGNVSARAGDSIFITPSGIAYTDLIPDDLSEIALDGRILSGPFPPSSEWQMHCAIYKARPEAGGIVHAHSDFATVLAVMKRPIPAFHYMVAVAGGRDIRCAPYATFGTADLAAHAVAALADRKACLLAHHGQIAIGETVEAALHLAHEVETLAAQYWRALQIGEPDLLSDEEMAVNVEKFRNYGRRG